jgi:DNA-binding NarL/FixJ family response regulator
MTARVLIVDDHPLTREALGGLLTSGGFDVVGQAADGAEAIERARELRPDLVVLDLTMPGMDGLTALPHIREAAPDTAVVVLTAAEDDANLLNAIRLGAAGYLLKNEPPDRIIDFLRGVANGEAALSGAVARRLMEQLRDVDGVRADLVPASFAERLSARELEVLLLLDQHLSTEEIAARLFISEHTVRSHVKNLLAKLGASSRHEALAQLAAARRG